MSTIIKIVGLSSGYPTTPFDGQYLVEFDPERDGFDPMGVPMFAHVVTSPDPAAARKFRDLTEAVECWRQVSQREPIRQDGEPNRPLTAFSVTFENGEDPG